MFWNGAKFKGLELKKKFKVDSNKVIIQNNSIKRFFKVLFYLNLFKVFAVIVVYVLMTKKL